MRTHYGDATLTPAEAIAEINRAFGQTRSTRAPPLPARQGQRSTPARSPPLPEAAELCRAGHLQGDPVPMRVRWSNGGGNPERPGQGARRPRHGGVVPAARRHRHRPARPDRAALPGQRSPEAFVAMDGGGRSSPARDARFLLRHPARGRAAARERQGEGARLAESLRRADVLPDPRLPLDRSRRHAESWVRYKLVPLAGEDDRLPERFSGPNRCRTRWRRGWTAGRCGSGSRSGWPAEGDDPHDPMSVWSDAARVLDAGTIEVRRAATPSGSGTARWSCSTRPASSTASSCRTTRSCGSGRRAYSESVNRRTAKKP